MPRKVDPQQIADAFELYLKYGGERFDLIEREMRLKGWLGWDKQCLFNRGIGDNFREGWIERYGWQNTLKVYLTAKSKSILTSGEKLLFEIETIRERIFAQIETSGVNNRDLIWQHDKYSQRSAEVLAQMENANDPQKDFAMFLNFLISISISISPVLARELNNCLEAIISRAKDEFKHKK